MKMDPNSFSDPHLLPRCFRVSATPLPASARPYILGSAETRNFARQNPAQRSAPAHSAARLAPPGRVPSGSLMAVFHCSPASVSTGAGSLADDNFPPSALATASPGSLPGGLRTSRSSGGLRPPPLGSISLLQNRLEGSSARTPYLSG
jgi:hypothetical protein